MHRGNARGRHAVQGCAIGILAAVAGLLPWLLTGMRLPLQNLWADPAVSPSEMPIALLPFSQYHVTLIAALGLTGWATAGAALRLLGPRLPASGRWATFAGVLMVQVGALVQTAVATGAGLRRDPVSAVARGGVLGANGDASQVYLTALVVGTAAAVALGAAVFLGISAAPAPLALVALAVASIAFASWCNGLVVAVTGVGDALATDLLRAIRWVPPVVTGLGVAATRLRTPGRVLGSVVALTTLWVGTAAVTAVSSAVGSRVLLSRPRELVDYGAAVFRSALGPAGDGLTLAAAAAVIGVVGAAVVAATAHRRRRPEPA